MLRSMAVFTTGVASVVWLVAIAWTAATVPADETSATREVLREADGDANGEVEPIGPVIADYGKVFPFPAAVAQPRSGAGVCVDVTGGGPADRLSPAIEKIARYVNLYGGGGAEPASDVRITAVLHGGATLAILNHKAYAQRFGVDRNPNLDCLEKLRDASVKLLVCGQSLRGKGARPDEVVIAEVAVSAMTAVVNRQADGDAMVSIR